MMSMDFLRGLAPPRESDPARAVPVLPPRFAYDAPLRERLPEPAPSSAADNAAAAVELPRERSGPRRAPEAWSAANGPGRADPPVDVPGAAAPRHSREQSPASAAIASTREVSTPRALAPAQPARNPESGHAARAPSVSRADTAEPPQPAAGTPQRLIEMNAVRVQPTHSPLSEACLARRVSPPREETTHVHVSIGRIEVVASNAPAAVRRDAPRREPTLALSEYLRGPKEGVR